ncbi:MAG: 3'-5' exonuclease domain-containing protein 2 [Candidatus Aminicenantes bacterium]|nr:3'-5' exonuclease domain-containing protein 2 [Candidatus Aminicenantes bacterium]
MALLEQNRLSRDYINSLPIIRFEGDVQVINESVTAKKVVKKLYKEKILGFDTESKPSFKPGVSHPISLIQVSTLKTSYLFQVNGNGLIPLLEPLLTSKKVKKVGVGLAHDINKLKGFNDIVLNGLIDLSLIAREKGIIQTGARGLTARYLQKRLVKTAQTTNWARLELSEKQKNYAATDAWVCLKIYPLMLKDKIDYKKFEDELLAKKEHGENF